MGWLFELVDLRPFLIAAAVFIPLERLLAARRGQPILRRLWRQDLVYVLANGVLVRLGLIALVIAALAASRQLVPMEVRASVSTQPLWLQVPLLMLVADLGFYAAHRLFHAVPALWQIHQVHHSIEEMDWLAGYRVHPIDQIVTKGASLLPCLALGFSDAALAIFALLYQWHSLLLHANVRMGFGPLKWLIASPDFHHWHHCRDREAWDRNFAGQLSLWDILFGTAYLPKGRVAERFGIGERVPDGYAAQLLHPFRRPGSAAARGTG